VGKYAPESIGIATDGSAKFNDIFDLGLCRQIVDIFDDVALDAARREYVKSYCPEGKSLMADQPEGLFQYFHHALFQKS
jgi:hypothetical protein